jgi:catechol 2,3-dioxygenase-like lactoylglutathione lyase family enzyme
MTVLHHVSLGTNDMDRALAFYDATLAALGLKRVVDFAPHAVGYGVGEPEFWIGGPHDQKTASPGNGVHIGFLAKTEDDVAAFYRTALAHGGTDDGAPGPRPNYGPHYYGAFVRDPDGNKIEACVGHP